MAPVCNSYVTVTTTVNQPKPTNLNQPTNKLHIPRAKKNRAPPEGYTKLVGHVCDTYEAKYGHKYPFCALDGAVIKRLSGLYTVSQVMALWDMFLAGSWDWMKDGKLIKCAHDLRQFQMRITILLEDPSWRKKAEKYEGQEDGRMATLASQVGQVIPTVNPDPLEGKIEALKVVKEAVKQP